MPVCQPWVEVEDLPCFDSAADTALLAQMVDAASANLYELSNRKYPGICEKTVQACTRRYRREIVRRAGWGSYDLVAVCGCRTTEGCGCQSLSVIRLPQIIEVSEITVNGVVVDPETYRVDEGREIVRLDEDWPCCDEVLVTYTTGQLPPPDGVLAAKVLACEFYLASNPETVGKCRLPKGVTQVVRNGINITISPPDLMNIFEVKAFLLGANPKDHRGGRGMVLTPDVKRLSRRIG